jgi:hypothetical protein
VRHRTLRNQQRGPGQVQRLVRGPSSLRWPTEPGTGGVSYLYRPALMPDSFLVL